MSDSNVLEFKRKTVSPSVSSHAAAPRTARADQHPDSPAARPAEVVPFGAHANVRMDAALAADHRAAVDVVRTLMFYANQGNDGGLRAQQALAAMQLVLVPNPVPGQ